MSYFTVPLFSIIKICQKVNHLNLQFACLVKATKCFSGIKLVD